MQQAQESRARLWARLRLSIIGPLFASPPGPRELGARLAELAAKSYQHPVTGQAVRFGESTIERWYYRARRAPDPLQVLRSRVRRDRGTQPGVDEAMRNIIRSQYAAHPSWTYQLLRDNVATVAQQLGLSERMPSYPTLVRFMHAQGLRRKPVRQRLREGEVRAQEHREQYEVRSFEMSHVHALWHLDFHVGSRKVKRPDGQWATPNMLCIIDDRSRLVCHAQWYWHEDSECLVHGLVQALQKRGLPRALLTDNGAAMLAAETVRGLDNLGITHDTTMAYSPYQNGKQEVFWAQVEGRLIPMLGDDKNLTLSALNDATLAWVEMDYQQSMHREIKTSPLKRFLAGPNVSRPCPDVETLRRAFTQRRTRVVRQSDGTISLAGQRFEVPSRLRALSQMCVEYARWDLRHVWAVDPQTDAVLASLHAQDKTANADRLRGRILDAPMALGDADVAEPMAPLLQELMRQYAQDGLPPAYVAGPVGPGCEVER